MDVMLEFYLLGNSAEDIVSAFSSLHLSDVHAIIAFYLINKKEVDEYLEKGRKKAESNQLAIEDLSPKHGIRQKLEQRMRAMQANQSIH